MAKPEIVGIGTTVVDHQVVLGRYPEVDTKHDVQLDRLQVGGPVPTALVVLQRLGWSTALVGTWGTDALGRMIDDDLAREGIDTSRAHRCENTQTGFAHVWIDGETAQRTIACRRSGWDTDRHTIDTTWLAGCRALHLDGWPEQVGYDAARAVRNVGGQVFLDTGSLKPGMEELLTAVDVVNCPRRFLGQLYDLPPDASIAEVERCAADILSRGPRLVTVTNGSDGALLATRDECVRIPAYDIDVVDTTGAGDVFSGALIHAVLSEWSAGKIVRFAAAAAGLKCRHFGNREALATLAEIEALCESSLR